MLSADEKREIEDEFMRYPDKQGACIHALKIVQQHRGWVSDDAVCDVADFLGMTADEVEGVATFYNRIYRRPVGRHVILLCNSVSCWVKGSDRIRKRLIERLGIQPGETSADGRFTLLPAPCLGACNRAPTLMVDEDLHEHVTPDKVDEILARYE